MEKLEGFSDVFLVIGDLETRVVVGVGMEVCFWSEDMWMLESYVGYSLCNIWWWGKLCSGCDWVYELLYVGMVGL